MAVLFSDPIDRISQFQQALDTFRTSSWLGSSPSGSGAYPPLNVFRKGDDLIVIAEVPGIRKSDLQIQVKGNTIRITGKKPSSTARVPPCIVANGWLAVLTARSA
jgi:HSP20 family protein